MKIAICGNYGVFNIGDELILQNTRKLLQKIYPACTISVLGKGTLFPFGGIRSFAKSIFFWRMWKIPYGMTRECNLFILGGGGLFTDEEGLFVSTLWTLHGFIALLLHKPVVILGVSIGKMNFVNRRLFFWLCKKARFITVRDSFSQNMLYEYGIKAYKMTDLAAFYGKDPSNILNTKNYVIMQFRPFSNFDENLYKKIAQQCDALIMKFGFDIKFLPFQDGYENDASVLHKIFEQSKQKIKMEIVDYFEDISSLMDFISGARLIIAMRLHAGIISLLSGTPCIPISYMQKVTDFWSDFPGVKPVTIIDLIGNDFIKQVDLIFNNQRGARSLAYNIKGKLLQRAAESENELIKLFQSIKG